MTHHPFLPHQRRCVHNIITPTETGGSKGGGGHGGGGHGGGGHGGGGHGGGPEGHGGGHHHEGGHHHGGGHPHVGHGGRKFGGHIFPAGFPCCCCGAMDDLCFGLRRVFCCVITCGLAECFCPQHRHMHGHQGSHPLL
ncbi:unnamed protein product [Discosporangium mesarthrocarpum]